MGAHTGERTAASHLPGAAEADELAEVLADGGIGLWRWDLATDSVSWTIPGGDGLEDTAIRFGSSAEVVALASRQDRAGLTLALRETAEDGAALRHLFQLSGERRSVIRVDGKRFGTAGSGHVIGISRDDTQSALADRRIATLFDERDRVARALETALLPPTLPPVPGMSVDAAYRSSEGAATGDFYDLFPTGGGDWALSIGDVGGHGPAAAAITTSVRYSMRTAALLRRTPSRVLKAANETHFEAARDERFTTCHFVRMRRDAKGVRLRVATAGHPALVIRRTDGTIEQLSGSGPMLGLMRSPEFVDARALLQVGDLLLAYTDGVTEARRGDAFFGEEGLTSFLAGWSGPIKGLAQALHQESSAFNEGRVSDDMATVVLTVDDLSEDDLSEDDK